jgi:hypothetical protein
MPTTTTSPTALRIHEAVRELRGCLGDDVAFEALRCASPRPARGTDRPTAAIGTRDTWVSLKA